MTLRLKTYAVFLSGVSAFDRRSWPEAVRLFRDALALDPREDGSLVRIDERSVLDLPHYYLGLALVEMGNCAEAAKELRASEAAGAIQKYPEMLSRLRNTMKQCGG
jgi:hypothetical protein